MPLITTPSFCRGTAVAEPLDCSPPTKANRNCAGRCCWSVDFPWIYPCIPVLLQSHLISPSLALETSFLRSTQISQTRLHSIHEGRKFQVDATRVEQRSYIKIAVLCGRTARECHRELVEAVGNYALPYWTVARLVSRCKRADKVNVNNVRVCSVHFVPEDYELDLRNELLGLPIRKKLLTNAIPSQQLPKWHAQQTVAMGNTLKVLSCLTSRKFCSQVELLHGKRKWIVMVKNQKRSIRKRALENLKTLSPKKRKIDIGTATEESFLVDDNTTSAKKIGFLETSLRKREAALKKAKTVRHVNPKTTVATSEATGREVEKTLAKCFTQEQIRCLLRGNKRVTWDSEDIANALTLQALSKKVAIPPLPCCSTLKKWTEDFKCKPGISIEVLCLLSAKSATLVVMIHGLFVGWKQPIFYGFDVTMMSELLKNIIIQFEACGITVVAVT
ncbi:hypothetical protein PR048_020019 [Dryococelus australis]|uniref:THAP-type domain-containing protein n=1 Tax=Dryococelus australis TaxID=614101 RepID=A0ABQ9H5B7_9NEOP|nr:hypothetical protein PR048_020019 [Dryococelus australis]